MKAKNKNYYKKYSYDLIKMIQHAQHNKYKLLTFMGSNMYYNVEGVDGFKLKVIQAPNPLNVS